MVVDTLCMRVDEEAAAAKQHEEALWSNGVDVCRENSNIRKAMLAGYRADAIDTKHLEGVPNLKGAVEVTKRDMEVIAQEKNIIGKSSTSLK